MSSSASIISASTVQDNDDLLIEILLFSSAISLVRYKLVSKRWLSLISAPSFCRRHTVHHNLRRRESQSLVIVGGYRSNYCVINPRIPRISPSELRFPIPSNSNNKVRILQSCNGLLLLRESKGERKEVEDRYYVLNPITMQHREVSPLPNTSTFVELYLMFDPSVSPNYRVVFFVNTLKVCSLVYLYDSETHEWKLWGETREIITIRRTGFYLNNGGAGICFPYSRTRLFFVPELHNNHVIKIPDLPPTPRLSDRAFSRSEESNGGGRVIGYTQIEFSMPYVMESNGVVLCLILSSKVGIYDLLSVWELKKKKEAEEEEEEIYGWSRKYEAVDMKPVLGGGGDSRDMYILCVIWEENEQDSSLLLCVHGRLKIYKFYDNVFEDVDGCVEHFPKRDPINIRYSIDIHHLIIHTLAPV